MYCKNCKTPLNDDDKYCQNCGTKVDKETSNLQEQCDYVNFNCEQKKENINNDIFFEDSQDLENKAEANKNNLNDSNNQNSRSNINGIALAGFICSFINPLVGLILCIIAKIQIKKDPRQRGIGLATAGIIISIVIFVIAILSLVGWFAVVKEINKQWF